MFNRTKALERAQSRLANQEATLKETLAQIEYIEKKKPNATALINALRATRNRQEAALKATQEIIELYGAPDPDQVDLLEEKPAQPAPRKR